jgi:trans-aconitate 2-methyltransferase
VATPLVQPNADAYQTFITTVICRPHLAHLADPSLRDGFIRHLTELASNDDPPFELDYWRLNIEARRPTE